MTAAQFAEKYKFTDNDKIVVSRIHGNVEKEEAVWNKELSKDFTFLPPSFKKVKAVEPEKEDADSMKEQEIKENKKSNKKK